MLLSPDIGKHETVLKGYASSPGESQFLYTKLNRKKLTIQNLKTQKETIHYDRESADTAE